MATRGRPNRRASNDHTVFLVLPLAWVLPARVDLVCLARPEIELVFLLRVSDVVSIYSVDAGFHRLFHLSHR